MKFRYILFVFLSLVCTGDLFSQTSWNWYNPYPQGNDLHGIVVKADTFGITAGDAGTTLSRLNGVFQSPVYPVKTNLGSIAYYRDTIWVAGDGGIIYRSTNNGSTWSNQSYSSKVNFHSCFDISKTDLFVAGDSGIILYSTNGGGSWTKQTNSSKKNINAIANGGKPNMYAVGDSGTILQALNFGSYGYFPISTPHNFAFHGVAMDTAEAYIVGDSGYILHRDVAADATISDTLMGGVNAFYDVGYFYPYVIAVGSNGAIRRSNNNGITWTSPSSGATEKLLKISLSSDFGTSGVAWVVGEEGVILRTANYGSSWSRLDSGVRGTVYAAAIAPNGDMYATSSVGKSYRLKNGAAHWTLDSLKAGGAPRLTDISFDKNGFGLIATYDINVLRTVDTGKTWSSTTIGSNGVQILGVAAWGSTGLACLSNGLIYHSLTKGGSWSATVTNNTQPLYDVDMSGTNAIAVGSNGAVLYSGDGGATWKKPATSPTSALLNKVRFFTQTNAIAVSNTGIIILTTNGGASWTGVTSGISTPLNDAAFHDDKNGIIAGDGGVILKTNDGGKTWSKDQSNTLIDLKGAMIANGTTAFVAGSRTTILGTTNSSLPVNLISFSGRRLSPSEVILNWSVASENNNFGYSIERIVEDHWLKIGEKNGAGSTFLTQNYSIADEKAPNELLQYRLRQIDLDGSEHILGNISIAPDATLPGDQLLIYPNPIQSDATIAFTISEAEPVRITIVDELGKEEGIITNQTYLSGSYIVHYSMKQLANGAYHIIFATPDNRIIKEFIVLK